MSFTDEHTDLQKKIDREVLNRVQSGVRFLEQKYGPNWVDDLDMEELDLTNGSSCVLGQLYHDRTNHPWHSSNGYEWATANFNELKKDQGAAYGFSTSGVSDMTHDFDEWEELQAAWVSVVGSMKRLQPA